MNVHLLTDAELERIVLARTVLLRGQLSAAVKAGRTQRNRADMWRVRCLNGRGGIDAKRLRTIEESAV